MPRLVLPAKGVLKANTDVDPLPYYYAPLIGRLFVARIDTGLSLLDGLPKFDRLLEVGYGSGLLQPTLATLTRELHGVDLEPPPDGLARTLAALGVKTRLGQGDLRALPYADASFDGIVAFSIVEHLRPHDLRLALGEIARVLRPGGHALIGCPAVHWAMNAAFRLLGFSGIEQHHFSSLRDVLTHAGSDLMLENRASLPNVAIPLGLAPYGALLLRRRATV